MLTIDLIHSLWTIFKLKNIQIKNKKSYFIISLSQNVHCKNDSRPCTSKMYNTIVYWHVELCKMATQMTYISNVAFVGWHWKMTIQK